MNYVYSSIKVFNSRNKEKVLVVIDEMISDVISNKTLHSVVIELFIRGRKGCETKHYKFFITKIDTIGKLQQIATNHSSDIDFNNLKRLYRHTH